MFLSRNVPLVLGEPTPTWMTVLNSGGREDHCGRHHNGRPHRRVAWPTGVRSLYRCPASAQGFELILTWRTDLSNSRGSSDRLRGRSQPRVVLVILRPIFLNRRAPSALGLELIPTRTTALSSESGREDRRGWPQMKLVGPIGVPLMKRHLVSVPAFE